MQRLFLLISAVVLLTGLFVLVPQRAAFASTKHTHQQSGPLCLGDNCDGQDPYAMQCVDSATMTVAYAYILQGDEALGLVENRYSPTCGTSWSKVTSYIGTQNLWGAIERSDGLYYCYPNCSSFLLSSQLYTDMVFDPNEADANSTACGDINGLYACTDWSN